MFNKIHPRNLFYILSMLLWLVIMVGYQNCSVENNYDIPTKNTDDAQKIGSLDFKLSDVETASLQAETKLKNKKTLDSLIKRKCYENRISCFDYEGQMKIDCYRRSSAAFLKCHNFDIDITDNCVLGTKESSGLFVDICWDKNSDINVEIKNK